MWSVTLLAVCGFLFPQQAGGAVQRIQHISVRRLAFAKADFHRRIADDKSPEAAATNRSRATRTFADFPRHFVFRFQRGELSLLYRLHKSRLFIGGKFGDRD